MKNISNSFINAFVLQSTVGNVRRETRANNAKLMNEITLMDELEELQEQQEMHMIRAHYGARRAPRCADEAHWGY